MNEKELFQLIKKALKIKTKVDIKSNASNLDEWDSIGHLLLLSKLDQKLKGKTSKISELATANSVKKLLGILKKNKLLK
mgnify:CR=1 FL=1